MNESKEEHKISCMANISNLKGEIGKCSCEQNTAIAFMEHRKKRKEECPHGMYKIECVVCYREQNTSREDKISKLLEMYYQMSPNNFLVKLLITEIEAAEKRGYRKCKNELKDIYLKHFPEDEKEFSQLQESSK